MKIWNLYNLWNRHGWTIIIFGSIAMLFVLYFFNKPQKIKCDYNLQIILNQLLKKEKETETKKKINNNNSWSKTSIGEQKCKEFMEFVFQKPFEKVRPTFLTNPITNSPLEIDCYNKELKLGVEYNGKQHYEYNKMMHNDNKLNFQNQQYRDYIKKDLCKQNNIDLIIVPYTIETEKIPEFLYNELKKLNYEIELKNDSIIINQKK